jgi:hypothetical protein
MKRIKLLVDVGIWGKAGQEYDVSDARAKSLCKKTLNVDKTIDTGKIVREDGLAIIIKDLGKYGGRYDTMKTIIVDKDGKFEIPKKYQDENRLHIRQAWSSKVLTKLKTGCYCWGMQVWFRDKSRGDKPYIPEGFVDINGERFKLQGAT